MSLRVQSASQNSTGLTSSRQTASTIAGAGIVKKATSYTPLTTAALGRLRTRHGEGFLGNAGAWRDNIKIIRDLGEQFGNGARDNEFSVSVVDEAHALINPEHKEGRVMGVSPGLGPQGYHIIRVSQVTIFLLDERQSFRSRENTTVADLKAWSAELGAEFYTVSLAGHQFRCAGSKEYVDWVEAVLGGQSPDACRVLASAWTNRSLSICGRLPKPENVIPFPEAELSLIAAETPPSYGAKPKSRPLSGTLDFRIFDDPAAMESALRTRIAEGNSARLLAPYAREWKTRPNRRDGGQLSPHDLPNQLKDLVIPYEENGAAKTWAKIWNFVPNNGSDYSVYIQGTQGSRMYADPLCEVGCPYAVRGFDWDYVGLLWLSDLMIDPKTRRWVTEPNHVFETGFSTLISKARNENDPDGPHHRNLLKAVTQCYRILLTRPIRGVYLWFEDPSTRRYIESAL